MLDSIAYHYKTDETMKPYVIDRRQLNFYIFFAVVLIITSFFLGFFTAQYWTGNRFLSLDSEQAIKSELESELPQSTDSDVSDTVSKAPGSDIEDSPVIKSPQSGVADPISIKPAVPVTRSRPPVASQTKSTKQTVKPVPQATAKSGSDTDDEETASVAPDIFKYSVQAGMFGNLENASRFLDQLQIAGFDGYMEEHEGADGEIRYNVRFGRFASRAEAEQRLVSYKRGFSTPAYVIINP